MRVSPDASRTLRSAEQVGTGLARTRCGERRIELRDSEIDVRIRVRAGDESGFERRGSEVHAALERCAVPAGEQPDVRALRLGEVADRPVREVGAPHRARVARAQGHPVAPRRVPYTRDQPGGSPLERLVNAGAIGSPGRRTTAPTAAKSLKGRVTVGSASARGMPGLSGRPSVATPLPARTRKPSAWP